MRHLWLDELKPALAGQPHPLSRISLARLSSRTSARSCLIVAASPVVLPGRTPASMSACLIQPRNVSGTIPTRGPIRLTAAFSDSDGSLRP